jgi:hypothetical protein
MNWGCISAFTVATAFGRRCSTTERTMTYVVKDACIKCKRVNFPIPPYLKLAAVVDDAADSLSIFALNRDLSMEMEVLRKSCRIST